MDKQSLIKSISGFFDAASDEALKVGTDVTELVLFIERIIPVHVELEITDSAEVDVLLSVYPFLYQKALKLYAIYVHRVRLATQAKAATEAAKLRDCRDALDLLLKAIKLQYDALSRRITVAVERR